MLSEINSELFMKNPINIWTENLWKTLAKYPGGAEAVSAQRQVWENQKADEAIKVIVFGPYDASKSTLLKRLLVERGTEVPDWLTISGRRETFETNSVRSGEVVFVDTPGFSGGNAEHDKASFDSLRLSDAFLWVLPPQLITTGKETVFEILNERSMNSAFPEATMLQSTIVAIARIDEAGIDPADNIEGFQQLLHRKTEEFESLLKSSGLKSRPRAVCCVAADPYQLVGNTPSPEPSLYATGREWDGFQALIDCLANLKTDRKLLRDYAGARFVAGLAFETQSELDECVKVEEMALEGCANDIKRHSLFCQRLDALRTQALAELQRDLEDALLSASRAGSDSPKDMLAGLERSLKQIVDAWSEKSFADCRRLANEFEYEIQARMATPSFAVFRQIAEDFETQERQSDNPGINPVKVGKKALGFGPTLRKGFENYANVELGMPLKVAAERLQKLEHSQKTIDEFIKVHGKGEAFSGSAHAGKASRWVKWGKVLDSVGPVVEQLGDACLEIVGEFLSTQKSNERAQRRNELRKRLDSETKAIQREASEPFETQCNAVEKWITERKLALENGSVELTRRVQTLKDFSQLLGESIREC
jgi:hypothetical protein